MQGFSYIIRNPNLHLVLQKIHFYHGFEEGLKECQGMELTPVWN